MSSKLNPGYQQKVVVPYCKKPPLIPIPLIPLPPGGLPPLAPAWLVAYGKWFDSDVDTWLSESFQIKLVAPTPRYEGASSTAYPYLNAIVIFASTPSNWDLFLQVHRSPTDSEQHNWNGIAATTTVPLKIHPPPLITIPGQDEIELAIYG